MKYYIILFFTIFTSIAWSQNQHEPQDWKKLNSNYVNVIYQKGQEQDAKNIADIISYIQRNNSKSIGFHDAPIDIVLRANTVESNGFVTYSPFRSEFFNSSPTTFNNLGSTDWLATLAIHEYRHVQQFLNHKSGATNVLYYLLGESGWGLGSALTIPNWYFEGDAVTMETALTHSGRGRLPKFTALQRALYKNNKIYKYSKIRNGSYKDLVPNQYPTGYQILNYYRNHFDASRLDNIAKKAASFSFPFYGFSYQLKKETGLGTISMYKASAKENQQRWLKIRDSLNVKTYKTRNPENRKVATYYYPQLMENGNVITLKHSLDRIPTFYQIDNSNKEIKIAPAISQVDNYFNYNNNQLVFTGFSQHPRYNYTNYNDVYVYDLASKTRKRITHKKKYFSPNFNKNNSQIIVNENNGGVNKLVILNAINGKELANIPLTGNITRPLFINDNTYAYIQQKNHQLAVFKINNKGNTTQLTPWTTHSIDNITFDTNSIYYSASFNGIDNIYQTPIDGSLAIKQITNAAIGAYQPSIKNNHAYFVEATFKGSNIASTKITPEKFTFKETQLMDWNNHKTVLFEEGNILDKIESKTYSTTQHVSIFEDLKFHDWNYSLSEEIISGTVTATNLLNDFNLVAATDLYLNENGSFRVATLASYKKWFPIINLELDFIHRNFNSILSDLNENSFEGTETYNDITIHPSITIPIAQVNGNYNNRASLNVGYEYHTLANHNFKLKNNEQTIKLNNPNYSLINLQFLAASLRRTARQHINTHAGVSTSLTYNQTHTGVFKGSFLKTNNRLFLPGIFNNHNSFISYAYQFNSVNDGLKYINLNADTFDHARGFNTLNNLKESNKLSFTYQLPLFYPDFGLAGITYFKRIRANLFADFSNVKHLALNQNSDIVLLNTQQNSAGFEIVFDNTFLNISQAEIGIGYRGSYLLTKDILAPNNQFVSSFFINTTLF